jgi:hypothetical protein
MNPKSPLCTGASYTKQQMELIGENVLWTPRVPHVRWLCLQRLWSFLFRDYRTFDQRLWSFCSEITELLIRDYGAFVQRSWSFFWEIYCNYTWTFLYEYDEPRNFNAHTLQSPSWQNERITQLSCLCWDDISMQVTASIAVWWPLLLSIQRHYLSGQSQGVSRCTNQTNCQCFFFSYFFLLANLGSLQRDWTIGLHMS